MVALSALLAIAAAAPLLVSAMPQGQVGKPKPTSTAACDIILCEDHVNECGMMYGGCFPACPGMPHPTFKAPLCPPTATPEPTKCPHLCLDLINECGQMYGGCFEHCEGAPMPTFAKPPCPTKPPKPTCPTVCIDHVNECGMRYGGCVPHCPGQPWPTFAKPACPKTTKTRGPRHARMAKPTPAPAL